MAFSISFQTACLGFFFFQGLLFSGLLLARGREYGHAPSYWLSLFVFLCSCCLVPFMMGYSGWYGKDGYREFLLFVFARGDQDLFTILSIALACGFNSKTTFNRVFKRLTARTPVQYLVERSKESSTTS
jgi:AraC-like DNA-binding protein